MLVIFVIHRFQSWLGQLIASLLWYHVWCLTMPWKLFLREKVYRSDLTWMFQALCLKCMMSSAMWVYIFNFLEVITGNSNSLCCLRNLVDSLDQQLEGFLAVRMQATVTVFLLLQKLRFMRSPCQLLDLIPVKL